MSVIAENGNVVAVDGEVVETHGVERELRFVEHADVVEVITERGRLRAGHAKGALDGLDAFALVHMLVHDVDPMGARHHVFVRVAHPKKV